MERTVKKNKQMHFSLTSNAGGYQPHEMVHLYESLQIWDC